MVEVKVVEGLLMEGLVWDVGSWFRHSLSIAGPGTRLCTPHILSHSVPIATL